MATKEDGDAYRPLKENLSNCIHRVNGYEKGKTYMYYPVVITGAGFAGIAMAYKLQKVMKFDQFRIFERQSGIGGTWWINRYPGIACDVPAVFYSYSFAPNPKWTSFYPPGPEIYNYLQDVCDENDLTNKIELDTDVRVCRWLKEEQLWEVQLAHMRPGMGDLSSKERARLVEEKGEAAVWTSTEIIRCKILISGVGGIVEPRGKPEGVTGWDKFGGKVFHSNRWDYSVDFKDKDVVVLGTGCSSAQLVPRLIKEPYNAKSVTQIMRSPPWVVAKQVPPGGNKAWAKNAPKVFSNVPFSLKALRLTVAAGGEWDWRLFPNGDFNKKQRKALEAAELERMKGIVPEKYHEILTPNYSIGCKRRIFDAEWFPSLNDDRIDLTTMPLKEVHERSVTLGPGQQYPPNKKSDELREVDADIIVLANGFDVTRWLAPMEIKGTQGQDLVETMQERGGPQAYMGTAVDGFPNFFIVYGPNTTTGHSSVVMAIENMVELISNFVGPILKGDMRTVEVKRDAEVRWATDIQRELKNTVFNTGGCNSWYFDKSGWNSTVLPYGQIWFWFHCVFPTWRDWDIKYTRKGAAKLALKRILRTSALVLLLLGYYKARRSGVGLREYLADTVNMAVGYSKLGAVVVIDQLRKQLGHAKEFIVNV